MVCAVSSPGRVRHEGDPEFGTPRDKRGLARQVVAMECCKPTPLACTASRQTMQACSGSVAGVKLLSTTDTGDGGDGGDGKYFLGPSGVDMLAES